MKKFISAAVVLLLFWGAAQAQTTEKGHRQHKGDKKEAPLTKLNLTADQKARFQSLREAQRKEMQALRKTGSVTPDQRKAVHEKYKTQYEAILTPAQRQALAQQKTEWSGKADKRNRAGKRGGGMGAQAALFKKELNLTTDQETRLTSLFQEYRIKAQDIRSSNTLSQQQKREQAQALTQQYLAQGKALLTPEQAKKFDDLKGKHINRKHRNL